MLQELFNKTAEARDNAYALLGAVDPDVIAHAINPSFMGGPEWPSLRQAFSIVRREESTIVISNGLSDPFDVEDWGSSGFGLEIMAESKVPITGEIIDSWLFKLVYAVSQEAACAANMANYISEYGVITREFNVKDSGLEELAGDNPTVGVIIGIEHPERPKTLDFPGGKVILATVQLLTPEELIYVIEERAEGRDILHRSFKESGHFHFVDLERRSLIPEVPHQSISTDVNEVKPCKPWWKFWS